MRRFAYTPTAGKSAKMIQHLFLFDKIRYNKEKRLFHSRDAASPFAWNGFGGICRRELFEIQNTAYGEETHDFAVSC